MKKMPLADLTIADLQANPIWEMVEDDSNTDPVVVPIPNVPTDSLNGRLVGSKVKFSDGAVAWAILGNISLTSPKSTRHFITASIHHNGAWFDLARYHDVDYSRRNGDVLAKFLEKPIDKVFPIEWDVSDCAVGDPASLAGTIEYSPSERLSDMELIRLSMQA